MAGRGPPDIGGMVSLKVDNLTYRTTQDDVRDLFQPFGKLGDVYIPRDSNTKESRGFAFVRFFDQRDAEDAMAKLDGKQIEGRELRVTLAQRPRPEIDNNRGGGGGYGGGGGGGGYGGGGDRGGGGYGGGGGDRYNGGGGGGGYGGGGGGGYGGGGGDRYGGGGRNYDDRRGGDDRRDDRRSDRRRSRSRSPRREERRRSRSRSPRREEEKPRYERN